MLETEGESGEWTKYKQARYFHKLAHGCLLKLDDDPLLEYPKNEESKNKLQYSTQTHELITHKEEKKASRLKAAKTLSKSSYTISVRNYNITHPANPHRYPKESSADNDLNKRILAGYETTPKTLHKPLNEIVKKKGIMTPTVGYKSKAKRNIASNSNKTYNIKLNLLSPKIKLKAYKMVEVPRQPAKERKTLFAAKPRLHIETSHSQATKLPTSRSPDLAAQISTKKATTETPKKANSRASQALGYKLSQPKQRNVFKGSVSVKELRANKSTSILKIEELVERFDEFVWKICPCSVMLMIMVCVIKLQLYFMLRLGCSIYPT
eukprot:TRINITY_DN13812_c0_g3_i3.p1 TRINITY_DN13812_c0_g3~~TRINITY_DN13812_c0_g3_i3.p1  ORF type:complete len:323 (-),score=47.59 TRINITY_DN13812_c0_g3_i3:1143-2111(-)